MHVTIQIPDDTAPAVAAGGDLLRRTLEALALEDISREVATLQHLGVYGAEA